jgi:hypothetical protein
MKKRTIETSTVRFFCTKTSKSSQHWHAARGFNQTKTAKNTYPMPRCLATKSSKSTISTMIGIQKI